MYRFAVSTLPAVVVLAAAAFSTAGLPAAALVARILAPGNTHKLAFPPAQTMVVRVAEIEKIPAKRVSTTVQEPVWEHETAEMEKLVPVIESGQPTGRFTKIKQRVVVKSKQVGTTTKTVEHLVPDPSGTETIERPKTVREPGGPAAWAPNLPGLNGMALYVLVKAGLGKHPATVKHAAALAAHADQTKGIPDSTFDVAWPGPGRVEQGAGEDRLPGGVGHRRRGSTRAVRYRDRLHGRRGTGDGRVAGGGRSRPRETARPREEGCARAGEADRRSLVCGSFREVCGSGAKKGVFLPCRRAVEASAGMDAETQRTCSERRAGGPQRTAGDMAGTPPTQGKAR
jgi:hypothetical protein